MPGCPHAWKHRLEGGDRTEHVHIEQATKLIRARLLERRDIGGARIGDRRGEGSVAGKALDCGRKAASIRGVGNLVTIRRPVGDGPGERTLVPPEDRDPPAGGPEAPRNGEADAFAAAGYPRMRLGSIRRHRSAIPNNQERYYFILEGIVQPRDPARADIRLLPQKRNKKQ